MSLIDLQQHYKQLLKEDNTEENAEREARDEGFDDFSSDEASGVKRARKIMEAIQRKESYTDALDEKFEEANDIQKASGSGTYGRRDTAALATWLAQQRGEDDFSTGNKKTGKPIGDGARLRDTLAAAIDAEHGAGSYPGTADWKLDNPSLMGGKGKKTKKSMDMEKSFPPALASLMSAAAGWALSGDVGKVGDMSPEQAREWERTLSAAERRNVERQMRSRMRRKSADTSLNKDAFESLKSHYSDSTDTYIQRTPIIQMLEKDHSAIPPRQGLLWDAVKHRWTRAENIGHTVTEVQGKKRFRGTGTGAHERSVGGHGSGKTRGVERGRRFKGATDAGVLRPHASKHTVAPKAPKSSTRRRI